MIFAIVGAVVGAIAGGGSLAVINWEHATAANITLATVSCAVLGGLLGFWFASFLQVALEAFWQATNDD